MPGDDEDVAPAARCSGSRRRGIFFCCSNTASSVAPVSMRKVSTWNWPCAEPSACRSARASLWWRAWPGRPRRAPVTGSSTRRQPTSLLAAARRRRRAPRAPPALSTPVSWILVPRLEGLHGRDQPLAEFAVDRAGEVAGPGEVVLDRHAVGLRDRRIGVLQARGLGDAGARRCRWSRTFGGLLRLRRGGLVPSCPRPAWPRRLRLGGFLFARRLRFRLRLRSLGGGVASGDRHGIGPRVALRERRRASQNHGQNRSGNAHTNLDAPAPHPSRNAGDAPMMRAAEVTMLTPEELERYARHIVLREVGGPGQAALGRARVLVIGAGGLGRAGAALSRRRRRRHARRDRRRHRVAVEPAAPGDPRHAGHRHAEGRERGRRDRAAQSACEGRDARRAADRGERARR